MVTKPAIDAGQLFAGAWLIGQVSDLRVEFRHAVHCFCREQVLAATRPVLNEHDVDPGVFLLL